MRRGQATTALDAGRGRSCFLLLANYSFSYHRSSKHLYMSNVCQRYAGCDDDVIIELSYMTMRTRPEPPRQPICSWKRLISSSLGVWRSGSAPRLHCGALS